MAQRKYAGLTKGTIIDYASPSRIMDLYGGDMKAIRAEYSRERSIVRKRVERMEAAGETSNITFQKFGNVKEQLPTVKELSDSEVLDMLGEMARQIGGGYKSTTLSQIQESRKDWQETMRQQAEDMGDEDLAEALNKPLTPKQFDNLRRMMGMIQKVVGKQQTSDTVLQAALKQILKGGKKESLLTKAARALDELGIDETPDGGDALEVIKSQYTAKGTNRVSWQKAHGKRGK